MLQLIDLQRIKHLKLDNGTVADSLSVHELRRAIKAMGLGVGPDDAKQDLLLRLDEHRKQQEAAAIKNAPYNPGAAIISAAKGAA